MMVMAAKSRGLDSPPGFANKGGTGGLVGLYLELPCRARDSQAGDEFRPRWMNLRTDRAGWLKSKPLSPSPSAR